MKFEEVLPHLRDGGQAKRRSWDDPGAESGYIQLVRFPDTGIHPQLMFREDTNRKYYLWGGINRDILEDDWEILP